MFLFRGFAKKTLLKASRKAGFKQKQSSKRQKYVLPNVGNSVNKYMTSPGRMKLPVTDPDDLSGSSKVKFHNFLHRSVARNIKNLFY